MANTVTIDIETLNQPLSYKDWLQRATGVYVTEQESQRDYNEYVTQWYSKKNQVRDTHKSDVKELYTSFLKDITLNYTTEEEKRFLLNIDFDNPRDLDIIIPFYAQKIKQITQYHVKKREEVIQSSFRNTLKGSDFGLEVSVKKYLLSLLSDESFTSQFNITKPDISKISENIVIETEGLYETQAPDYDLDPKNLNNQFGWTSTESNHSHYYEVDKTGNGWAYTSYHPDNLKIKHKHEIKNWTIITSQSDCYPDCESMHGSIGAPPHKHTLLPTQTSQLAANIENMDPLLFLDMTKVIINDLKNCDTVISTSDCDSPLQYKVSQSNNKIGVNISTESWQNLPLSSFIGGEKTYDNLIYHQQKDLIKKFAGTRFHYLSTGPSSNDYITGILFEPDAAHKNVLNRYHSGHLTVPNNVQYKTIRELGGFFVPSKVGMLTFASYNPSYTVNVGKLKPNTVYAYPDPAMYGTGRGLSRFDQFSPIDHVENVSWVKYDKSNNQIAGDVIDHEVLPRFNSYQSREESTKYQPSGLSKYSDNIDFWKGNNKNIWANEDLYPTKPLHDLPIDERLGDLLISDSTVHEWRTDIFGNEFALYKLTHAKRLTQNQKDSNFYKARIESPTEIGTIDMSTSLEADWFDIPPSSYYGSYEIVTGSKFLNSYNRFAANEYFAGSNIPAGASAESWASDSNGDVIYTINGGFNGLINTKKSDTVTIDCVLHSPNTDDDMIGLVIGFNHVLGNVPDRLGTVTSTERAQWIGFCVSNGGYYPSGGWGVLQWDGVSLSIPEERYIATAKNSTGGSGWLNRTIRIRVEKRGNIISGWISNWGDETKKTVLDHILDEGSKISIDIKTGKFFNIGTKTWDDWVAPLSGIGLIKSVPGYFSEKDYHGIVTSSQTAATWSDFNLWVDNTRYMTQFESTTTALTADAPLYERNRNTAGTLQVRNIYSSAIEPMSAALSAVFLKYHDEPNILNQINNQVMNFDIIKDVLFIETPDYLVVEKYKFDFNTERFASVLSRKVYQSLFDKSAQRTTPVNYVGGN